MYSSEELFDFFDKATEYYLSGKRKETDKYLDMIISEEATNKKEFAHIISIAYSLKAENLSALDNNPDAAVDLLLKANALLELIDDDSLYNFVYLYMAKSASKIYLDNGNYKISEIFSNDLCKAYEDGYGGYDDYLIGLHNLALSYYKQDLRPKSRETLNKAIEFSEENNLQETNIGILLYNTKNALFPENEKSIMQDAYDALSNCNEVTQISFLPVINAVSVIVLLEKKKNKVLHLLQNAIECIEDYVSDVKDDFITAQVFVTRSLYEAYIGNYKEAADLLRKAITTEIESYYTVDVVMINLGVHAELYEKVFNADEFKTVLLDIIRGFPYRAWELLKLSDEMSLFKGLSHLSEYYKYVLTEHYLNKIHLTDIELVEIVVNCKNIYSDILRARSEIKYRNSWYKEQYEEIDGIHRDLINLQLGKFFDHSESEAEIKELINKRHEKERQLFEEQSFESLSWKNIYEIEKHLPENALYVDYTVIPPVEANKDAYISDLVYNRFILFKADGNLIIKRLPYQNLVTIRYQFELLERLLRDKYGKGNIFSLGRLFKGDNAVLIGLYRMLFKEAVDFAKKCGAVPKAIIVSGDAELSSFPYDALIDDQGKYLVEKYEVINVNSLRNYYGPVQLEEDDEKDAVVLGNPLFTIDPSVTQNAEDAKYLVQIPLSKIEAQAVADAIGVKPLLRTDANKNVIKENNCRILHIATHGDHLDADYVSEMRKDGISGDVTNPMLTNCIFMSGANDWIVKNTIDETYGNGIITAEEFCTYTLPSLKLVTLSACFTGSGDINYQLGLIGMRTALMVSGANAIITNLWEVDDFAAAVFMTRFYNNLKSMTVSSALREAKIYLMNVTVKELTVDGWFGESRIRRLGLVAEDMRKISAKSPDTLLFERPFYWAGFTLLSQ